MVMTETAADLAERRADIESWLDERRVKWEFDGALSVSDVDANASLANQARLEPLNEEVVDRYAADMERGDVFPPILVVKVSTKRATRYVLAGGNHRLAAAERAKVRTLAAYIVVAEPEMVVRLTFEDNRRHGLPPSEEERIYQAVHLVNQGYTQSEAAEVCGVSPGKLQRSMSLVNADQRAKDLGVKRWESMPKTTRWRLGNIQSDPVFREAAQIAVDSAMPGGDIFDLVTRVNAARSEEAAFVVVRDAEEVLRAKAQAAGNGAIRSATSRSKLLGALSVARHLDAKEIKAACATPVHRADLVKRIDETIRHLTAVRKALG